MFIVPGLFDAESYIAGLFVLYGWTRRAYFNISHPSRPRWSTFLLPATALVCVALCSIERDLLFFPLSSAAAAACAVPCAWARPFAAAAEWSVFSMGNARASKQTERD